MVQDSVFCFQATESLKIAMDKEQDPDLKQFLAEKLASYTKYARAIIFLPFTKLL